MENTGNGGNESVTEQPVTVESSKPSPKKGRKPTGKTAQPITPAEAGAIMQSALALCLQASLPVRLYEDGGSLFVSISGLGFRDGEIIPVTVTEAAVCQDTAS